MDINKITIERLIELLGVLGKQSTTQDAGPWIVGNNYLIRTVTMAITGELTYVSSQELVLKDAAWVADVGRFSEAVRNVESFEEVEPFSQPAIIGRGSIVDATIVDSVPTMVK